MSEEINIDNNIERCVSCNTETPYSVDTHIDERQHYVEGSGQLCEECWDKIYNRHTLTLI